MKIGDKVRFLNDVGGGKITAFRPGGIVLVEDADGFDVPMPQNEVVVIEEEPLSPPLPRNGESDHTVRKSVGNKPNGSPHHGGDVRKDREVLTLNGKDYLKSKTVVPADEEEEVDENLEARVVRLEMTLQQQTLTIQKLEARIALLEAENNLRKNEKLMVKPTKQRKQPEPPTNIDGLQIL